MNDIQSFGSKAMLNVSAYKISVMADDKEIKVRVDTDSKVGKWAKVNFGRTSKVRFFQNSVRTLESCAALLYTG